MNNLIDKIIIDKIRNFNFNLFSIIIIYNFFIIKINFIFSFYRIIFFFLLSFYILYLLFDILIIISVPGDD